MAENKFDKLTIRCIEEIPFLVEVIYSTGKEIEDIFSAYYDNLEQLIKEKLPKRYWKINERDSTKIRYFPISYEIFSKKIESLDNIFSIQSEICIEKKVNGMVKNAFRTNMGFLYNIDEEDAAPKSRFYFQLTYIIKKSKAFNDLSFYKKIEINNPSNNFIIHHPDLDPEQEDESIEIYCKEIDTNKIAEIYNIFKKKIVIPFIENLK